MRKEGRVFRKNTVINKIENEVKRDINSVAAQFFSGTISSEDELFLQEWLKASADNAQILEELRKVWTLTGQVQQKVEVDADLEWNRFVALRDEQTQKTGTIFHINFLNTKTLLRIAAVLIPVMVVLSVYFVWPKSQSVEMAQVTTLNEKAEIVLSDGTKVWLNKNSKFEYPKQFASDERRVKLEGEAFFEVSHTGSPFFIDTKLNRVQVLGTQFNVRAYLNEPVAQVSVKQGKVLFASNTIDSVRTILTAGQAAQFECTTHVLTPLSVGDVNDFAWKENKLLFTNVLVSDAAKSISHYFGIEIVGNEALMKCRFSGEFDNPHLNDVLSAMTISLGATFALRNDTVFLKNKQ